MSIHTITSKENLGKPGVTEIQYTGWNSAEHGPLLMQESYAGCVLATFERNGYDDSDFYAIVWDETQQCIRHIKYASTRAWTYPNHAEVDATPAVIRKAREYCFWTNLKAYGAADLLETAIPSRGKVVEIFKGRKYPIGTRGTVIGDPKFYHASFYKTVTYLLVTLADYSTIRVDQENLRVICPEHYRKSPEEIRNLAEREIPSYIKYPL